MLRVQLTIYLHPWSEGDPPPYIIHILKGPPSHENINRY